MVHDPASDSPPPAGGGPARRRRAAGSAHPPRPHRRRRAPFYAGALDAGDRADLADAAAVRGLDQEIAVLRLRVRRMLGERPDDLALLVRSIELLVRAVGTAARLASADSSELLERITAELGGIAALLAEAGDE
jgi:hypothetical protein